MTLPMAISVVAPSRAKVLAAAEAAITKVWGPDSYRVTGKPVQSSMTDVWIVPVERVEKEGK